MLGTRPRPRQRSGGGQRPRSRLPKLTFKRSGEAPRPCITQHIAPGGVRSCCGRLQGLGCKPRRMLREVWPGWGAQDAPRDSPGPPRALKCCCPACSPVDRSQSRPRAGHSGGWAPGCWAATGDGRRMRAPPRCCDGWQRAARQRGTPAWPALCSSERGSRTKRDRADMNPFTAACLSFGPGFGQGIQGRGAGGACHETSDPRDRCAAPPACGRGVESEAIVRLPSDNRPRFPCLPAWSGTAALAKTRAPAAQVTPGGLLVVARGAGSRAGCSSDLTCASCRSRRTAPHRRCATVCWPPGRRPERPGQGGGGAADAAWARAPHACDMHASAAHAALPPSGTPSGNPALLPAPPADLPDPEDPGSRGQGAAQGGHSVPVAGDSLGIAAGDGERGVHGTCSRPPSLHGCCCCCCRCPTGRDASTACRRA